jgi:hypothetical protein
LPRPRSFLKASSSLSVRFENMALSLWRHLKSLRSSILLWRKAKGTGNIGIWEERARGEMDS